MSKEVITYINENLYGIWFLIGAALVFWMQAGFAMVETGFTRAKNAGISWDLSENPAWIFLQLTRILITPHLYLT